MTLSSSRRRRWSASCCIACNAGVSTAGGGFEMGLADIGNLSSIGSTSCPCLLSQKLWVVNGAVEHVGGLVLLVLTGDSVVGGLREQSGHGLVRHGMEVARDGERLVEDRHGVAAGDDDGGRAGSSRSAGTRSA